MLVINNYLLARKKFFHRKQCWIQLHFFQAVFKSTEVVVLFFKPLRNWFTEFRIS